MYRGVLTLFCCLSAALQAQLPAVDIYTGKLSWAGGTGSLSEVRNITNRSGYDNQPSFSADGKRIYFSSIRSLDQADIYMYDIATVSTTQVTQTPTSEYSPVVTSKCDAITVVRVEPDSVQRIWVMSTAGAQERPMLTYVDSVGYYTIIHNKYLAFFKVTDTPSLVIADMKKQEEVTVDVHIGRCIKHIPGTNSISYLVKSGDVEWHIFRMDVKAKKRSLITTVPAGYEDFVWTPTGILLMARGSVVYQFDPLSPETGWVKSFDVPMVNGKNIFRMALTPDGTRMAFVAEE